MYLQYRQTVHGQFHFCPVVQTWSRDTYSTLLKMLARRLPQVTSSHARTVVCRVAESAQFLAQLIPTLSGAPQTASLSTGIPSLALTCGFPPKWPATKKSGTLLATGMPRRTCMPAAHQLEQHIPTRLCLPPGTAAPWPRTAESLHPLRLVVQGLHITGIRH